MQLSDNIQKGTVFSIDFNGWEQSLTPLLDLSGLVHQVKDAKRILIKPNLVENLKPPITTPVGMIKSLVQYLKKKIPGCEIIIGEGCGSLEYDTSYVFNELGYTRMAQEEDVTLLDLNNERCVEKKDANCKRLPIMYLPELLFNSFIISAPVLKAHSLAGVTLTMKNMMGTAPPKHYQQGGHWKKASFHKGIQEAIFDLNRYRSPDFTLLDASVGMARAHLWGPTCSPPVNKLAAGYDPVAMDAYGSSLLDRDWRSIGHISMAHGVLGDGKYQEIITA